MAKMVALAQGGSGGSGTSAASAKKGAKNAQGSTTAQAADAHGSQVREISGLTEFPADLFPNGEIPRKVQRIIATQAVNGYPALVDEKPA